MSSPSSYRRQGRNAFYRDGNPADHNPYEGKGGLAADIHSRDWLDGWAEAAKHDDLQKSYEARDAAAEEDRLEEFVRLYDLAKERGLIV